MFYNRDPCEFGYPIFCSHHTLDPYKISYPSYEQEKVTLSEFVKV